MKLWAVVAAVLLIVGGCADEELFSDQDEDEWFSECLAIAQFPNLCTEGLVGLRQVADREGATKDSVRCYQQDFLVIVSGGADLARNSLEAADARCRALESG